MTQPPRKIRENWTSGDPIVKKSPPAWVLEHGRRTREGQIRAEQGLNPPKPPIPAKWQAALDEFEQSKLDPFTIQPQTPVPRMLQHPRIQLGMQEAQLNIQDPLRKVWTATTPEIGNMEPTPDPDNDYYPHPTDPLNLKRHYTRGPLATGGNGNPFTTPRSHQYLTDPRPIPPQPVLAEALTLSLLCGHQIHPREVLPVRVLKAMRRHGVPLTIGEIYERTQLQARSALANTGDKHPRSEILRHTLHTLANRGYVLPCDISSKQRPGQYLTPGYVLTRRGRLLASRYTLI